MEHVFIRLKELSVEILENFTISINTFEIIKSGWSVSLKGAQNFESEIGMIQAIEVALKTSQTVCCWRLENMIYWDVVQICETELEATRWAKRMDQPMIYHIDTGTLKWLI